MGRMSRSGFDRPLTDTSRIATSSDWGDAAASPSCPSRRQPQPAPLGEPAV